MGFRLVHYRDAAEGAWGLVQGERVLPLPGSYPSTAELLAKGAPLAHELAQRGVGRAGAGLALALAELELLSPVTHPCRIVAQGANYRSHLREVGLDPEARRYNMLFRKSSAAICGPHDAIVRPEHVKLLDYEVELGLVIGVPMRGPQSVEASTLHRFVAALVVANDVSARDVQLPQTQFYKGKSYRSFCPLGPFLFLPEPAELARIPELRLTLRVNDEVRQDETCADMVFGPAESLSEISQLEDLDPGDLVLTGTPGGVALRPPPALLQRLVSLLPEEKRWSLFLRSQQRRRQYLRPGDRVSATIRTPDAAIDLGVQHNLVR